MEAKQIGNNIKYWKEDNLYIIKNIKLGVATQGRTVKEAKANLKEAVSLYRECTKPKTVTKKIKVTVRVKPCVETHKHILVPSTA